MTYNLLGVTVKIKKKFSKNCTKNEYFPPILVKNIEKKGQNEDIFPIFWVSPEN